MGVVEGEVDGWLGGRGRVGWGGGGGGRGGRVAGREGSGWGG